MSKETEYAADLARELAECRAKLARYEAAEKELFPEPNPLGEPVTDGRIMADRLIWINYSRKFRTTAIAKIAELEAKLKERDYD